ncbi:hypothetical protein WK43_11980 [Burkholderia ubonensis]|nr:hypothetical protein WI77_14245 [Burkholderia ubonensis]KVS36829.1 hypothetical protein WK37_30845 [Burkholderia ubonensis]KVS47675.1 hypothetical protein WK38_21700 [Burkholderia ubonensis]KVS70987.1 hypothetical protein WK42_26765 [Burkholderia ubonensis]KVS83220.1 hypothetical protein WK44_02920 [Burkholderia ubonensis]
MRSLTGSEITIPAVDDIKAIVQDGMFCTRGEHGLRSVGRAKKLKNKLFATCKTILRLFRFLHLITCLGRSNKIKITV